MAFPKIIYNSITLTFSYPPTGKQATESRHAERVDSVSTAGVVESTTTRIDKILPLTIPNIPGSDISAWAAFMDGWALLGKPFDYYPDSGSGTHTTYMLMDTDWSAAFAFKSSWYKFSLKMKKYVAATDGPLTLSLITPSTGSPLGGTTSDLYGTGFVPGTTVVLGPLVAFSIIYISSTHLQVVNGAHATFINKDVVATNPDGSTATLVAAYSCAFV